MQLSVEWICGCKEGVKIKWSIRIDYWIPESKIVQMTRTFSSGKEDTPDQMEPPVEGDAA